MAYKTVNPFNNQLIKEYANHNDAEIEVALTKADALYHSSWSKGILISGLRCCTNWPI